MELLVLLLKFFLGLIVSTALLIVGAIVVMCTVAFMIWLIVVFATAVDWIIEKVKKLHS